ncbi:podocalyxin [Meles meles]|uniref:podocalyxin n=1 Tax=Meles meles TaxID=9662 RepID=UPI001E69F3E2|nr:podocalyxin [Meles meles]
MRSALALSALLLLLPPRSFSDGELAAKTSKATTIRTIGTATTNGTTTTTKTATTTRTATTSAQSLAAPAGNIEGGAQVKETGSPTAPTTTEPMTRTAASSGTSPTAPSSSGATIVTTQTATDKDGKTSRNPSVARDGSEESQGLGKMTPSSTTHTVKPESTSSPAAAVGAREAHGGPASSTTPGGGKQAAIVPTDAPSTSSPASLPASASPTSPRQPSTSPGPSQPPVSPSDKITAAPSSSGTKAGSSSTFDGTLPTTTSASLGPLQGDLQKSSVVPTVTGTASSTTGTSSSTGIPSLGTSHPTGPSSGPVATSRVEGSRSPGTQLTSVDPRVPSVPPSSTHVDNRIKCESPEGLTEEMLILNLTKTSLCAENGSSDDKLVTLLCRAAKATFNPLQDKCHILLVPVHDSQAVAIKEITVQTNLLPQQVYELLKDKWDELKEVGVSNMKLGEQGPPEETEDRFSMPLIITIVCMASFLLLVAALYGCCHQRVSQRKDQQRLTEELQTVENGYHDNPTLEVMETSSEMQEKKVVNLNGELGDSWIVPLDNLAKDDLDEEEDTHL